jgi:hypothetical protein
MEAVKNAYEDAAALRKRYSGGKSSEEIIREWRAKRRL